MHYVIAAKPACIERARFVIEKEPMPVLGCGLNGSTQHFALVAQDGLRVEESKETSTHQGSKGAEPLEASGVAGFG